MSPIDSLPCWQLRAQLRGLWFEICPFAAGFSSREDDTGTIYLELWHQSEVVEATLTVDELNVDPSQRTFKMQLALNHALDVLQAKVKTNKS